MTGKGLSAVIRHLPSVIRRRSCSHREADARGLATDTGADPAGNANRDGWRSKWLRGGLIAAVAFANLAANTDLHEPPRYDGAGYSILARSLLEGRGYREIDHPDGPRHTHFPPGYPVVLASLWAIVGISVPAAHLLSIGCTLAAILICWTWFASFMTNGSAWLMGLALAWNWRWGRDGGAIRSEPLFLLLMALTLLAAWRIKNRGGILRCVGLGLLLGSATLTRHIGIALIAAVTIDLWLDGRRFEARLTLLTAMACLLPWAAWLTIVGRDTQLGLLPRGEWLGVLFRQTLFYVQRLPDQITGPLVEVGTVFRPGWWAPMTLWATFATILIVLGWVRLWCDRTRRLAGLIPLATLTILLVWPFTEAGRFLVPLVPFILVGAAEGFAHVTGRWNALPPRTAATLMLLASIPYATYAALTDRAGAERARQDEFDAACVWIAQHEAPSGTILTRHPGEAFLQTGRLALAPSDSIDPEEITRQIARYRVLYVLVDGHRYANAPKDPLLGWIEGRPDQVELVLGSASGVAVYRVQQP